MSEYNDINAELPCCGKDDELDETICQEALPTRQ